MSLSSSETSIFDIQYTVNPGSDNTYPSLFRGQVISTRGIVTTGTFRNNSFFISSAEGGPWNGIQVIYTHPDIKTGDEILISGEVHELFGNTVLRNITSFEILSRGNNIPNPTPISLSELTHGEKYEGVLVRLQDITVKSTNVSNGKWIVGNNSGSCIVDEGFFNFNQNYVYSEPGEVWDYIIGIVEYRFGEFRINPVSRSSMQKKILGTTNSSWGRIKSLYR